jgi:hypothetical protein
MYSINVKHMSSSSSSSCISVNDVLYGVNAALLYTRVEAFLPARRSIGGI